MFEICNTLSFNTDVLVDGQDYDYVTRTSLNQGVLQTTGFVNKANINSSGTWSLGLLQMDFFYRSKPWYAGQFVRKIIPKIEIPNGAVLFFTTLLNKQKKKLLSVLVRDVDKTFKETMVKLPITINNKINFDFMESFIAELEAERIAELSAYLTVSGLDNYELSKEEKTVLSNIQLNNIEWGEYKLGDLFDIQSYKKRFDANKVTIKEGAGHPYIVRQSSNNGKKGNIDEDPSFLNPGNTISFGQDTATMFYQEFPYFTGDKIKILKPKFKEFNKLNVHFFLTAMRQSFSVFAWGSSSFNVDTLKAQIIVLPSKDGKPDYKTMELLIAAIQKLVIKDVALYADRKIQATKDVVNIPREDDVK